MRAFSYFFVLLLAAFLGKKIIGMASVYLWLIILGNIGIPSPIIANVVAYAAYIISWVFALVLLFRVYLCVQHKKIAIPDEYIDGYYIAGIITTSVFSLAVLGTALSAFGAFSIISGVPFGIVLLPTGLVSIIITLRCEIPAIRGFIQKR